MSLFSLSGKRPNDLGAAGGRLKACPGSPNCVSSDAPDRAHAIEPLTIKGPADKAWEAAQRAVAELPGAEIVTATEDYLHIECTSRLLGFVDDLELHLRASNHEIAVRSASRLGYSDLGVNRKRVEMLRKILRSLDVVV